MWANSRNPIDKPYIGFFFCRSRHMFLRDDPRTYIISNIYPTYVQMPHNHHMRMLNVKFFKNIEREKFNLSRMGTEFLFDPKIALKCLDKGNKNMNMPWIFIALHRSAWNPQQTSLWTSQKFKFRWVIVNRCDWGRENVSKTGRKI